jgi:hypothetical protein
VTARGARHPLVLAGRAEAARLTGHPLVVAAFAVAAALIWWGNRDPVVLLWWSSDISIGSAFLIPAAAVLIAAQRAVGRPRRDRTTALYESYPVPESVRTGGLLLGLLGPVVLAAAVEVAAVIWLDHRGAFGAPQPAVLIGAVLLVALGGAAGVAMGTWMPQPAAAILTVVVLGAIELDLVLTYNGWVHPAGGTGWLFPWYQPGAVPGELAGISLPFPWLAHAIELAALTGLAAAVALRRSAVRRGAVVALAAVCAAAVLGSGWSQLRPIPVAEVNALVAQTLHPARFERCETRGGARYCFFPAFAPLVSTWAAPVSRVLAGLPAAPSRPLLVREVTGNTYQLLTDPPFGLPNRASDPSAQAAIWKFGQQDEQTGGQGPAPTLKFSPSDPPIIDMSDGDGDGDAYLDTTGLAVSTAYWAVGLPTTAPTVLVHFSDGGDETEQVSCEPVGQAREAIAIWLAASAVPRQAILAQLTFPRPVRVSGHWIVTYLVYGSGAAVIPQVTAQGAALVRAMLKLPAAQVEAALAARWPGWLSPAATDAQLAAALRLPLPVAPAPTPAQISAARADNGLPPVRTCP